MFQQSAGKNPQEMLKTHGFLNFCSQQISPTKTHDLDHFSRHRGQWYVGISGACGAQRLAHDFHPRAHRSARAGQEAAWGHPGLPGLEVEFAGNISEASLELVGS